MPNNNLEQLRQEVATVKNDILYPFYGGDRLEPRDETLIRRGGGGTTRVYDVYQDILRDCHAYAVLQKRYMEVIGREWEVVPASTEKADIKAADLCRDILQNLSGRSLQREDSEETELSLAGGFDQSCLDLLPAILNGFSASELMWDVEGKEYRPVEIVQRDIRRFVFCQGDRGYRLRLLTPSNLWDGEPIPARKMLVHRFSSGGMTSDPYGLGLGTRLFYPVYFKRNDVKFWLVFADKHGSPTAVIKYPRNASKEEQASYKKALKTIAQDAGIVLPEGVMIEFLEAQRGSTVNCYKDLKDFCDSEMSKCVLGETGSTDQSGGGGSRARDEVGNSVRLAIAKFDADMLSDTLNRTLLSWITRLNYGEGVRPPKVWRKFPELEEKEDLNSRIGRDKQLFDLGFRISKDKVEQVYGDGYESSETQNQEPPLVTRLGVSGTASFMQFLGQIAQGSIPRENAVAALSIVFGMSSEEADAIVPKEAAIAEQTAKNPETEPNIEAVLGENPPAPTVPEAETPPVELTEGEADSDPAELFAAKARAAVQGAIAGWVDQINGLVQTAESFEEIQERLTTLYPDLAPQKFSETIAQAMAASELAGRWEVLQEGGAAVQLSEDDAPNYRLGDSDRYCMDCIHSRASNSNLEGWLNCDKFDFEVDPSGLCDDFERDSPEFKEAIGVLATLEQVNNLEELFGDDALQFTEQFADLLEGLGILRATD